MVRIPGGELDTYLHKFLINLIIVLNTFIIAVNTSTFEIKGIMFA